MQRRTLLITLGGILVALVIAVTTATFVWRMAKQKLVTEVLTPQEKVIDISALVTQVRELNRLETASMHVLHVGKLTQSYKLVPNAIGGDEITFLAEGDVIAGLDLSRLTPEDVWRSPDGTVNIRLPKAEVLVISVDNAKSRVLTRKTGVLRRADVDLETRARQHAEKNIRSEALKRGVLKLAADNGEKKLADFLHAAGIEKVRFVSRPGAAPASR
ncbi:MAG TPA: DUF4230 domain-containing protein [Thermoanaerobaculia bacterium]|nr:DUF4230 domain-containing protein [Thermoanaerobaculia bacterium]